MAENDLDVMSLDFVPGNSTRVLNYYSSRSKDMLDLVGFVGRDDLNGFYSDALKDLLQYGSKALWMDDQHKNLKQLTATKYVEMLDHLPLVLRVNFSELLDWSNGDFDVRNQMMWFLKWCQKDGEFVTPSSYREIFSKVSVMIKKNMKQYSNWRFLTDWETLNGYNLGSGVSVDEMKDIIQSWCKGDIIRNDDLKLQKWYDDHFYKLLKEKLVKNFKLGDMVDITLADFMLKVNTWMTDGSSRGVRMNVELNGKIVKSRAKKQVLALKYSVEELRKRVLKHNLDETYSVSEKIEPGRKKRLIVSAPYEQQIRMSFVEYYCGPWFRNSFTDVFSLKSPGAQLLREMQILRESRLKGVLFFPLDASKFDQYVSYNEVNSFFTILEEVFVRNQKHINYEILDMMHLIRRSYFDTNVVINKTVNMGKLEHGVPSGVRWTALLDSVINSTRFDLCKFWYKETFKREMVVKAQNFQGDDMGVVLVNAFDLLAILYFYKKFNIPIHPIKNFVTHDTMEFLRKIYTNGVQSAYPVRMICKYSFRLPESRGSSNNQSLIRERCNTLYKIGRRFNNLDLAKRKMMAIITKVLKCSEYIANELVITPTALGGLGLMFGNMDISPRVNVIFSRFTWSDNITNNLVVKVTGVYNELATSYMLDLNNLKKTEESLRGALNPNHNTDFNDKPGVNHFRMKFNKAMNIKMKLDNLLSKEKIAEWRVDKAHNSAVLPDLLSKLSEMDDYESLLNITSKNVVEVTQLCRKKMGKDMFWDWVQGLLYPISIMVRDLSSNMSSKLINHIFSNYFYRFLRTHNDINRNDYLELILFSFLYVLNNVEYLVRNGYLDVTSD